MAKTIHSMIRVLDETVSCEFYKKAFGLSVADRLDFDSFTLIYLSNSESNFELELTVNKDQTAPYDLGCLLYTSPSPRDKRQSRMPSSA